MRLVRRVYELVSSSSSRDEEEEEEEAEDEGVQLKRMESGSLLAIWAMCFRMSFLVMIPSNLLQQNQRKRRQLLHIVFGLFCHGKPKK